MNRVLRLSLFLVTIVVQVTIFCAETTSSTIPEHQSIEIYEAQRKVDQVLFLMQKRLAVMHEVARTKWNQKIAIEDLVREKQILTDLAQQGSKYGFDKAWVQRLFQAQMDAAKMIQTRDFALWTEQGVQKFDAVLDLKSQIRPYLDQLTGDLLEALSKIYPDIMEGKMIPYIPPSVLLSRPSDHIDDVVWQAAVSPLHPLSG